VYAIAKNAGDGERLVMVIQGTTIEGDEVRKTVAVNLGAAGADGRKRLADAGLQLSQLGDTVQIANVRFGSRARKAGINQGFDVVALKVENDRPSAHWLYLPSLALVALVWWLQGRAMRERRKAEVAA
jgi:hypothetical protein